ncbi:MAG: hypothetical protein K6F17_07845 [Lachnospiraceae bacterium]|nr:hypothetical protein [Lachnospiraceae bacterium]
MNFRLFCAQVRYILRKKSSAAVIFILMSVIIVNYFGNLAECKKIVEVTDMFNPFSRVMMSSYSKYSSFVIAFFPILAVLPTATLFVDDRNTRINMYILGRSGEKGYYISKLLSIFTATFVIFIIPFFLEFVMTVIAFPLESGGMLHGPSYTDSMRTSNYILDSLFWKNNIIYALVMDIVLALAAACLAIFNSAITIFPIFRYKIFSFLPVYVFLYIVRVIDERLVDAGSVSRFDYVVMLNLFDCRAKDFRYFVGMLVIMVLISFAVVGLYSKRKEVVL